MPKKIKIKRKYDPWKKFDYWYKQQPLDLWVQTASGVIHGPIKIESVEYKRANGMNYEARTVHEPSGDISQTFTITWNGIFKDSGNNQSGVLQFDSSASMEADAPKRGMEAEGKAASFVQFRIQDDY
jgi:hypothetical protein